MHRAPRLVPRSLPSARRATSPAHRVEKKPAVSLCRLCERLFARPIRRRDRMPRSERRARWKTEHVQRRRMKESNRQTLGRGTRKVGVVQREERRHVLSPRWFAGSFERSAGSRKAPVKVLSFVPRFRVAYSPYLRFSAAPSVLAWSAAGSARTRRANECRTRSVYKAAQWRIRGSGDEEDGFARRGELHRRPVSTIVPSTCVPRIVSRWNGKTVADPGEGARKRREVLRARTRASTPLGRSGIP